MTTYVGANINHIWSYQKNILCHIQHIRNGDICGTEQISCESIWNADKIESYFCYTMYINTCDYICSIYFKNGKFKIQCTIWYL